jgi:hypothetical protein
MKSKKIYILVICLAVVLTGCSFGLAKKQNKPEVKKELVANNVAITSKKVATSTMSNIASSTDDMSNWKTYRNKIIGIEFKYPSVWQTLGQENVGDTVVGGEVSMPFDLILIHESSVSHVLSNYDNLPIDEQYKKFQCPRAGYKNLLKCENKISSNGVKYAQSISRSYFGDDHEALVAPGKYILYFNFSEEDYNKWANEYQKILSTLKITE